MNTINHPEHDVYTHHNNYLTKHEKTLNRISYKGFCIKQKTTGFFIDEMFFASEKEAKNFIDRRFAFDAFFDLYGEVCTWFTKAMFYRCKDVERIEYANWLIQKNGLPLSVEPIKNGFAVMFQTK